MEARYLMKTLLEAGSVGVEDGFHRYHGSRGS